MAHGKPWARHGYEQVLEAATSHGIWREREAWKAGARRDGAGLRGTGLAIGGWVPGLQAASATVRLNADGTLSAITGSVDISGTNISLAQIAATAFGVDVDQVQTINGDSDSAPFAGTAAGSKTTYTVGSAVLLAAQDARRQTFDIAAAELETSIDDLELVGGRVQVKGVPERGLGLGQIGKMTNAYMTRHAPVLGRGSFATTTQAPGFSCQVARVEVDPDTGLVTLHDYLVVQDVGFAINPIGVEGQMLGGAVQGLGIGLTEELQFDPESGRVLNPTLLDYRELTAADLPSIDAIIVEVPSEVGPLGARGVGEPPIVPGAAALANAVLDATGVQITELPITPERVALALAARRG